MRADLVSVLRCPVCADGLAPADRTARCPQGHSYDLAKQGYLNLLPPASTGIDGDTAEMVEARAGFLGAGWYEPIRAALVDSLPPTGDATLKASPAAGATPTPAAGAAPTPAAGAGPTPAAGTAAVGAASVAEPDRLAVEVGAGTAYYLAGVVAAGWRGIATDVSRYAARRAAKAGPAIGSVVCDAWRELPLRDGVADVILDVFAPRNAQEMARILAPGGTLLVVTPNQEHLGELVELLGLIRVDEEKERRLVESLEGFERVGRRAVETTMRLDHAAIEQLVAMTPSARHLDRAVRAQRIGVLAEPVEVTLSVTVSSWQRA
ncbi:Methyltransferase type 11 [Kribbella flavida DSM 17836]|uniref:Methyltransferase type 11 n=1 Tax=Kribbella flavida (strain DSM 17836 / JCM 10339 / NBRC 14399) TaxID=479435 RepID=D2Q371_KRIFD|nr:methyltransferase domain-containing protein [Kribbella flavida]ADB32196.1 Methyltransferase type 11 [Kribbella flavida DSM 17836]